MQYLFRNSTDRPEARPTEELFLTQKAPESLTENFMKADAELERVQAAADLPAPLYIIKWLAFLIGTVATVIIINRDVPLAQNYQGSPGLFWVGGCSLAIAGALLLLEKYRRRKAKDSEGLQIARKRLNSAERAIREYLSVPGGAEKVDILFSFDCGAGDDPILYGTAFNCEMRLFQRNEDICLFNGRGVYTFHRRDIKGIRVVDQGIPIANWNKPDPPSKARFRKNGVVLRGNKQIGLRFCCALDIDCSNETYSLLFPAYELDAVKRLTGLTADELPPVTVEERVKRSDSSDLRQTGGKVCPRFYWNLPKDEVRFWFTPWSDMAFQSKHPVLYVMLIIIGITVLLLPAVVFSVFAFRIPGAEYDGWVILGAAGGFIVGIGLFNIVAAWMRQYLGHFVTIICFLIGAAMMAVSWFLIN